MSSSLPSALAVVAMLAATTTPGAAMQMAVEGERLVLGGEIDGGSADAVIRALTSHPNIRVVVLRDSPGGAGHATVAVANLIRERRLETQIAGRCLSGCALLFMGGARRTIAPGADPANAFVAFHGTHADGRPEPDWQRARAGTLVRLSGGRLPRRLAAEMMALPNDGFAIFYHPRRHRRADGASVVWCLGPERPKPNACAGRRDVDGLRVGIFTH